MLPMALDALVDVMEARVESSRLEKERAAVLSEMTMVNTIEYRVECQILSTLHRENRLAKRFPIGKEKLIRTWQTDDVKSWHRTHYRPDNVLLYLVGDVDPDEAERIIADKFGRISAEKQGSEIVLKEIKEQAKDLAEAVVRGSVKAAQSWHYPPVRHDWCVEPGTEVDPKLLIPAETPEYDINLQKSYPLDEDVFFLKTEEVTPGKKIRPHIFRYVLHFYSLYSATHVTLQYFSFASVMSCFRLSRCTCSASVLLTRSLTWSLFAVVWPDVLRSQLSKFVSMLVDVVMILPLRLLSSTNLIRHEKGAPFVAWI